MRVYLLIILLIFPTYSSATCRSTYVKHKFDLYNGYKHGRKGYIVDHICALACGGTDTLNNLQYQTKIDALAKDKWETTPEGCKRTCNITNSTSTRQVFNCK